MNGGFPPSDRLVLPHKNPKTEFMELQQGSGEAAGEGDNALGREIQPAVDAIAEVRKAAKLLEAVEAEAREVAGSFCSLLTSVKSALSEVSSSSVEHMRCYNDAAGQLQDASIEAATKGNKFVNSCLRLNEEMKDINAVALQLKVLRQAVDQLEHQTNRHLLRP